ncbi:YmfL family putative regulatory protein [Pantoea sp. V108_6]|uniref:YmfL family putative regulatory protein n=1 Tax=Pantoea sp. V108_6 TaxID=3044235 RepID=UPI00249E2269|nr:YmfL family putative regulatory protein [Pantoea sp. V108_6]MDI3365191.1 YmfL family putative regulatory protein [Pantoea sp. V108_6]
MVDTINIAIRHMCKAHKHGRLGMAADLGMSIDQFHNHLYRKCGSRFFTLEELMQMEALTGTHCVAEFMAVRHGMLLVDIKAAGEMDKVDLFDTQLKVKAAEGELATAQLAAMADGIIDHHESKTLSALFRKKISHQVHGFFGLIALFSAGTADHAVDMFVSSGRKTDVAGMQFEAQDI